MNPHGFTALADLDPIGTTRPGVFSCGVFQGPKDIPQSVMEASAAAAAAARTLAPVRHSLTRTRDLPPEIDFTGRIPGSGSLSATAGSISGASPMCRRCGSSPGTYPT